MAVNQQRPVGQGFHDMFRFGSFIFLFFIIHVKAERTAGAFIHLLNDPLCICGFGFDPGVKLGVENIRQARPVFKTNGGMYTQCGFPNHRNLTV